MIRVQQFTEFAQIANELLALYREGCELKQTYPLLRRWQEILKAMPLEARKLQPWIVCDMPPGCSQSYVVQTTHPTKADDSWRMEWMPFDISPSDEQEIRDHLSEILEAWLRVTDSPDTTRHDTPIDFVTLLQCAGIVNKTKRTLERWKQDDTAFPTPEIIGENGEADEWSWATIRPYLETKSRRKLPEIFPAHIAR